MSNIKDFLTDDHRTCDTLFALMEQEVSTNGIASAKETFEKFSEDLVHHFTMEEMVMFPEFEQKTGMTEGPTKMMTMEHEQMRSLLAQIRETFESENQEKFFGLSETLMILMQQHNMKEEQMLYPMAQQHLGTEAERIILMMDSIA